MTFIIRITFILLTFQLVHNSSKSQNTFNSTADQSRSAIEAMNRKIEQLYLTENENSLTDLYIRELTFFPEYRPAIFDAGKLREFFRDWFKAGEIKAYKKSIFLIEVLSDHILEIGNFNLIYSSLGNPEDQYNGKYMMMWKRDDKGNLRIVSETFGSVTYIEPEAVPYAHVQFEASDFVANHTVSNHLLSEIEEFDSVLLKAVAEGDGETRAKGFTADAILLANFDSVRVGMESIRPKMLGTYKPGSSYIVKHTYSRVVDLGDYVLVNGHYKGGPADPKNGGPFEGKFSSLMKRNETGKLLMYRQIANRDNKQH